MSCLLYETMLSILRIAGIGWNMNYPFNSGDLLCCGQCAANYLDANARVPWEDLRSRMILLCPTYGLVSGLSKS